MTRGKLLPPPLDGADALRFEAGGLGLCAWTAGAGAPLVLVHSVNAAASAAEVRPVFTHFAAGRTVYAIDLPGFGASDRPDVAYDPRRMTDAVQALVALVAGRHGGGPVDVLGLSLSCEFVARAAAERPDGYRSLALVSPTGFRGLGERRGPPGSTRRIAWLHRALSAPGVGPRLYGLLTRPAVIRYFLRRTWGSRDIDEALWRYDVVTARQPGAHHAPLHFLSGGLFAGDISNVYEALTAPVWMTHGVRGDFTDYRGARRVAGRGNWRIDVLPTGALPFFEVPARFCADYERFLAAPAAFVATTAGKAASSSATS